MRAIALSMPSNACPQQGRRRPTPKCCATGAGGVISPTHKRDEGRAPVWGSEFTSKDAALQGGSSRNRFYAERKIVGSGDCVVTGDWWWNLTPLLAQSFTRKSKADEERAVRGSFAVVGLCFCTSHLTARCPSVLERPPQRYGHRFKLAEGTSPRRLTYHCTDKV
jgi:hypothetical protein